MSEPFVFHFAPGSNGHPDAMYIADLKHGCSVCGFEQFKRFYHAHPLHRLSVSVLQSLADSVPEKLDGTCENCGSPLTKSDVLSSALTFGFPDDAGLVQAFGSPPSFQFLPTYRLDPQKLPGFEIDDAKPSVAELTDDCIETHLDRVLDVKATVRQLVEDFKNDPDGGVLYPLSGDTFVAIDRDAAAVEAIWNDEEPDLIRVDIRTEITGLGTHENTSSIAGHYRSWLPESVCVDLERENICIQFGYDYERVRTVATRALTLGRLTWDETDRGIANVRTPREVTWDKEVTWSAILQRAAVTGLTGGDAARLTAEEIVGLLLRVWR